MNDRTGDSYLRAEVPRTFTVLGQRLNPFSLWHLEVLLRFDNSFLTDSELSPGDLFIGVFFCCQTWEEGLKAIEDDNWADKVAEWGATVGSDLQNGPIRIEGGNIKWSLEDKAKVFMEHLAEGCGRPELLPADGETNRAPGAPLVAMLKLFLMRELRKTESEAMNFPFARAAHLFFAFYESEGRAKIVNDDERETFDEHADGIKTILAEIEAKKKAEKSRKRKARKK